MANGTPTTAFDSLLGGWKTYITAGLGILVNLLSAFGIYEFTPEQMVAVNGVVILAAVVFLRMGMKKTQVAAAVAAEKSTEAADQSATAASAAESTASALLSTTKPPANFPASKL